MPTAKLHNLARMTTATTGTGTLTLGAAVAGHLTFAAAGATNGSTVTYAIADGANSEIGRGLYSSAGPTLTRATILRSTNSGLALNLSGAAEVMVTAAAEDFDVNDFTEETTVGASDLLWIHDASAADRRKMTVQNLLRVVATLADETAPDHAADFLLLHDTSTNLPKRVLPRNVGFPSGTRLLFQQTTAPTGWTKDTTATYNDKALRIVTGTVTTNVANQAFSTVFGKTSTDNTTLSTSQMPAHQHNELVAVFDSQGGGGDAGSLDTSMGNIVQLSGGAGSGGAHSHGMDIRLNYVDVIVATKD